MTRRSTHVALVVEDNEMLTAEVCDRVESLGHRVHHAGTQVDAEATLSRVAVCYVMLDLELPVRKGRIARPETGFNILRHIRSMPEPRPSVIVMTAHGSDHRFCLRAIKLGAADFLKKPFEEDNDESPEEKIRQLLAKTCETQHPSCPNVAGPGAASRRGGPKRVEFTSEDNGRRRYKLIIDGQEGWLRRQQYLLLWQIAAAEKRTGKPTLTLADVEGIESGKKQAFNRLRDDLNAITDGLADQLVHADAGEYGLTVPTEGVVYDAKAMRAILRELTD